MPLRKLPGLHKAKTKNGSIKNARRLANSFILLLMINRFPQNEQLKKEASDLLKQYTKTCNMNREKISSIQAHSLYNVENSSTGNA